MMQPEQESGESAPIVTDHIGAGDVKRIQQRHCIVGEAGPAAATAGSCSAEAAPVRYEQSVVARVA